MSCVVVVGEVYVQARYVSILSMNEQVVDNYGPQDSSSVTALIVGVIL